MTERIRLGAVVRLPANTAYGTYAIVVKREPQYVTVAARGLELIYHRDQLEVYGDIAIERKYISISGNRFARCVLQRTSVDVKVRDGQDGSEETRALEIRKLAFVELMKELR